MNRELKFRYYDEYLNDFRYSDSYEWPTNSEKLSYFFSHANSYAKDGIIQQYTGLKDKNGVLIYEGDIITYQQPYRASRLTHPATTDSYRTIKAPVVYNQDKFTYEIDGYSFYTPMIKTRKDIEIISNIFENPELIEKQ